MNIKVLFFGILEEIASTHEIIFSDIHDIKALEKILNNQFPDLTRYKYLISVNHEIVKNNALLKDKDEIALLPPFAGG
ncbi:MAG: MoaD/ThiS family protein [Chlorobi bacterium]|nr:MoaD/ThiS family protein [Chlorobiota bacterium]